MSSDGQPSWFKDATIYQTHVRAFHDSDGDGIGDFVGLTSKLEYLADLGVTAIWILPFYPSPLRDDGYDIADYTQVHDSYGTIRDFRLFLREARRQGLRVITELVLNHTSDQHAWFQRARRAAPGSPERDFYVWNDNDELYPEARIIFKDFEASNWTWDREAGAYFWHRFYHHQPDLNFDNPAVHDAVTQVLDYWLDMGVDGLRLDAVPYLYEREGTNCENLRETHDFLRALRTRVDAKYSNRMLLAEANQWPEDAVAYFGDGDECHMAFHFPVMPRMFMAIQMEDRFPIIDILEQTPPIPQTAQWAMFLRNHDELTLEMVTDEERDYMYRVYAADPQARINLGIRRRLAPLLGNDRRKIELMNGLLFSLPGTPIVYYGDEIGMGDNIYLGDRNGVRTPMQWSPDRNAGFSRANPQSLYLPVIIDPEYHYESVNVEAQQNNPNSLLWWMKRLIALRKRWKAFGSGSIEFLLPSNRKVLAFVRAYEDERVLVVANLSRHTQYVELDLSRFRGHTPVELFGGTEFAPVGDLPYLVTLGPHAFYWFGLTQPGREQIEAAARTLPTVSVAGAWQTIFSGRQRASLDEALAAYVPERRWFGSKARRIRSLGIAEAIRIPAVGATGSRAAPAGFLAVVHVEYTDGEPENYLLPLTMAVGERAADLERYTPQAVVCRIKARDTEGVLVDGLYSTELCRALFDMISRRRSVAGRTARLRATPAAALRTVPKAQRDELEPHVVGAEQSNTSVLFGSSFILKLFRRLEEGQNPDLEIGRFLSGRAETGTIAQVAGSIEYVRGTRRTPAATVGILQEYVHNEGDAWEYTLDEVGRYFERALSSGETPPAPPSAHPLDLRDATVPDQLADLIGSYRDSAALLGRRTAQLHTTLASGTGNDFAPEPFSDLYRRSLYQSMRSLVARTFAQLRERRREHPQVDQILELEDEIQNRFRRLLDLRISAQRIRCHGDYHLGQVLFTGRDFVIIDFEGEPARALSERRLKRQPLRDVAGMLRSFHYAAFSPVVQPGIRGELGDPVSLHPWAGLWNAWIGSSFLDAYMQETAGTRLHPDDPQHLEALLDSFLLEKAVYELGYELNNRPDWLQIPIVGVLDLIESGT